MDYDTLISAMVTLAAAFLGAWSAFKLEDRARKRKKVEENIAAGNRAIFMLLRMFNELFNIQQQVIEPVREHPAKSIVMLPLLTRDFDELRFEVDNLSFLLETKNRQILMELLVEENRFHTAIRLLNERSNLHLRKAQPLLEKAGIVEGGEYTKDQVAGALGQRIFNQLQRYTDQVIWHIDQSIMYLQEASKRLHSALTNMYPDTKFIRFEPNKEIFAKPKSNANT